jgi:ABC-type multidrug transport system ATPase subunit
VTQQLATAQRCIGYSPQFEALTAGLTGCELLLLYAALWGVKCQQQAAEMAQQLLQGLGLAGIADVPCGAYSGGNKARLSVAVALVAQPQLVLFDELSTGMDAAARHALWKVLQVRQQAGSDVVIWRSVQLSGDHQLLHAAVTSALASVQRGKAVQQGNAFTSNLLFMIYMRLHGACCTTTNLRLVPLLPMLLLLLCCCLCLHSVNRSRCCQLATPWC